MALSAIVGGQDNRLILAHACLIKQPQHLCHRFRNGHEVTDELYGVTEDAQRFFGLLSLRSAYTGYEDTVGLRNSNDRSFPVGLRLARVRLRQYGLQR